jgi:lysophospholipase L1-like esterase
MINKIISVLIVIVTTLVTTKIVDVSVGIYSGFEEEKKTGVKPRTIVLREYTPNSNDMLAPYGNYKENTENLEYKKYRVRSDDNGFIIGPKDLLENVKLKNVDIIFFGGSTTESLFVDEEIRFPYLVSEMLVNHNGNTLRVLNGGLSGNNTLHSILAYQAKGIPLKPKYVILMHAINDLSALSKSLSYWETTSGRDIVRSQIYDNVDMYEDRGRIYKFFRVMKDAFLPNIWKQIRGFVAQRIDSSIAVDEWADFRNKKLNSNDIEQALKYQYKNALLTFVKVSRIWGSEPILMTQFNRLRSDDIFVKKLYEKNKQPLSYNEFIRLYEICNNIIREVAEQEKVLLIDLEKNIEPNSRFIYDAVHLNNNGSKVAAEIIAEALAKNFSSYLVKK